MTICPARTVRKIEQMAERAGISPQDFLTLVERLKARGEEVPEAIARLALLAREHRVPSLSHDDMRPEQRQWFRALHCRIAEFPTTVETAEHSVNGGDDVVLGAPNVVRGGSHVGWINATEMIKRRLCTVLASDYYYPAPLLAPCPDGCQRRTILRWLKEQFAGSPSQTSLVDRLALVEQATGPFRVIRASSLKR